MDQDGGQSRKIPKPDSFPPSFFTPQGHSSDETLALDPCQFHAWNFTSRKQNRVEYERKMKGDRRRHPTGDLADKSRAFFGLQFPHLEK